MGFLLKKCTETRRRQIVLMISVIDLQVQQAKHRLDKMGRLKIDNFVIRYGL